MHNNYYLLTKLVLHLQSFLKDGVISECYSQNREELVIRIEVGKNSYFIKANLQSDFPHLSFPDVFHRAKKNSIDLFTECIGERIEWISCFNNDRSFAIYLNNSMWLLFKLYGTQANIILYSKENALLSVFRNNIKESTQLIASTLNRKIDWSESAFYVNDTVLKIKQYYFTFGKLVWEVLETRGLFTLSKREQWLQIVQIKNELENSTVYFTTKWRDRVVLSLLPVGEIIYESLSPTHALTYFCAEFLKTDAFLREKNHILQAVAQAIQNTGRYIEKTTSKLYDIEHSLSYKTWADLLMAYMHEIKPEQEVVCLQNFDNNKFVEIRLRKGLSAQKNASIFYQKSKNQQIEISRLKDLLIQKEEELIKLQQMIEKIEQATDLDQLKKIYEPYFLKNQKNQKNIALPYHEFIFSGFVIRVGKNARANDALTLNYSYKDDLWLHVKDVAGSHVVIKYQAGKKFPKDVIERAAQLAAYYSKRKTETLVPVMVTPKKFVRKRKADPAGMVVVEKESVLLIQPKP